MEEMDFSFPFPSLKQAVMVTIAQQLANKKLGAFAIAKPDPSDSYSRYYSFQFEDIITILPLPTSIKPYFSDVLMGMHHQMWFWLKTYEIKQYEVVFDSTGRLNEPQSWEIFFHKNWRDSEEPFGLHSSLLFAIDKQLLPQIDSILHNILVWAKGRRATMWLEGPEKKLVKSQLSLYYRFVKRKAPAYNVFQNLQIVHSTTNASLTLTREGIRIIFMKNPTNFQILKEWYYLLPQPKRMSFVVDTLFSKVSGTVGSKLRSGVAPGFIIDAFQLLYSNLDCPKSLPVDVDCGFCRYFLQWPFTHLFVPIFKRVDSVAYSLCHFKVFIDILEMIPESPENGTLYVELFLDCWGNLPADVRHEFYMFRECEKFLATMSVLQRKNEELYTEFMTDLTQTVSNVAGYKSVVPLPTHESSTLFPGKDDKPMHCPWCHYSFLSIQPRREKRYVCHKCMT